MGLFYDKEEGSVKWLRIAATGVVGAFTLVTGCSSYKIVPAQSYGVRVDMGLLESDHLEPGFYWKKPFFESIDVFNNNTVILPIDSACSGNNTSDQNALTAAFRIHYRVDPRVGMLVLNLPNMRGDNGQSFVSDFVTDSCNAVVGSRPATDTLADPEGFLRAFKGNLSWRLAQNNVPVRLDAIELLTVNVGGSGSSNSASSGLRRVFQMRILPNGTVEQMSGPAAVPASSAGNTQNPGNVQVEAPSNVTAPSVQTQPLPPSPAYRPGGNTQ